MDWQKRIRDKGEKTVKEHSRKRILKYFLIGLLAAVGGMFFSDITGDLFNGMDYGSAVNLGIGMYLCVVVITCTGVIVSHLDKKE